MSSNKEVVVMGTAFHILDKKQLAEFKLLLRLSNQQFNESQENNKDICECQYPETTSHTVMIAIIAEVLLNKTWELKAVQPRTTNKHFILHFRRREVPPSEKQLKTPQTNNAPQTKPEPITPSIEVTPTLVNINIMEQEEKILCPIALGKADTLLRVMPAE